jgi:hypothetical protein
MTRIAIHQQNFCPWFPFFYKMALADYFVMYDIVQFEKNGYQNRCMVNGKWWTKPVHQKLSELIYDKDYVGQETNKEDALFYGGGSVKRINELWIQTIKETLNIKTILCNPPRPHECEDWISMDPNHKLLATINSVRRAQGITDQIVYLTNEEAKDKYLDEELLKRNGIEIEYVNVPRNLKKHIFELFDEFGIEGTIKLLPKKTVLCEV